MGIWTGIKKALNSTLGTSGFKPLDKIVTDLIFNNKSLTASDDLYYVIAAGENTVGLTAQKAVLPYKIRIKNSGSVRINVGLRRSTSAVATGLDVLVNDVQVGAAASGYSDDNYNYYNIDVPVPANGIISFQITGFNTGYFKDLRMCAKVIDTSLFEDITNE